MNLITLEQTYKLLSEVCNLLNKNNIQYLVYGSVALNLLTDQEKEVHDIDIIVKESGFDKIIEILPLSLHPIQTEFSIHANSKEYLGSDNKPFDISFDSYEHYFQKNKLRLDEIVQKEIEGQIIKIMPLEILKIIYQQYSGI